MKKHFSIRVTGRVQGVFFRASALREAEQLGLVGFAQNEPDGDVYIEVEGEEEQLVLFAAWCRRGPARASVDRCDLVEGAIKGFTLFEIRR